MAFDDVRFPVNISRGARGGPTYRTEIVELASGYESRNSSWAGSRRRYDISYGVRRADDLAQVVAFFEARRGRGRGFRFKDWGDYKTGPPSAASPVQQHLYVGDGVTKLFELYKTYSSGLSGEDVRSARRYIKLPVDGTLRVKVVLANGVSWPGASGHETPGAGSGIFYYTDPPPLGAQISASFEYDVPVRFDTDSLDVTFDTERLGSITSIPLVEIRI